jgi:ubiquinone/menaquinone biosynthesis C-methylase UbiE
MRDEKTVITNMKMVYNEMFKWKKSDTLRNIWREVYGEDYPEEVDHNSPVTMTDLCNISKHLKDRQGKTIIDIGCGRGGPGMWVAREVGGNYFGLDLSEVGIEEASRRAKDFDLEGKAQFKVGDICETDIADNSFDAAISIGAIAFIPNKLKVMCEVARILRLNGLFVFITVEEKKPHLVNDYRPLLREAGFNVKLYEETPDYNRRHAEVYKKIIENKKQLIKEMGFQGAALWVMEAKRYLPRLKIFRRVLAVAEKE